MSSVDQANQTIFGPNVFVFNPSMNMADIQAKAEAIFKEMEANQFGTQRYALLFQPGTYDVLFDVGFYTSVAGLGQNPDDVLIRGGVNVPAYWMPSSNATCNFWRSFENLAIDASDATNRTTTIAVSQAAPLRRIHVKSANGLWLFQVDPVTHAGGWASGGYMADCVIDGQVLPGSQQQWFSRNSQWGSWANGVWNMVFVGCQNAPSDANYPQDPYTTVGQTPVIREKPYIYMDGSQNYAVFVPSLQTNSQGASWLGGSTPGTSIPIGQFFVAQPTTATASSINAVIQAGQHVLFTPGIYNLEEPLSVERPDTIILGLGMPSIVPPAGREAIVVGDIDGVMIGGFILDAGSSSPSLLTVGASSSTVGHAANPTLIFDITARTGGPRAGQNDVGITINSNDVVCDHLWLWRADHGEGAGWQTNPTRNGITINGNNVTIYGLFNEHHEEYQTLWNGENGRCFFYQSEIPYDVPNQEIWQSRGEDGTARNGFASYKVANNVQNHTALGLWVYCYFRDAPVKLENAIEAPVSEGIHIRHLTTVWLNGQAGSEISHIINGRGNRVYANAPADAMRQVLTD